MKLIIAIIRDNQLDQVREALIKAEITRITVNHVSGHGRKVTEEVYRGQKVIPNLASNIRLEIAVNDNFVDKAVDAICGAAQANDGDMIGGGKIFVLPIEQCIRIRTGEKGSEAI